MCILRSIGLQYLIIAAAWTISGCSNGHRRWIQCAPDNPSFFTLCADSAQFVWRHDALVNWCAFNPHLPVGLQAKYGDTNLMKESNLSLVIGPNLLRKEDRSLGNTTAQGQQPPLPLCRPSPPPLPPSLPLSYSKSKPNRMATVYVLCADLT